VQKKFVIFEGNTASVEPTVQGKSGRYLMRIQPGIKNTVPIHPLITTLSAEMIAQASGQLAFVLIFWGMIILARAKRKALGTFSQDKDATSYSALVLRQRSPAMNQLLGKIKALLLASARRRLYWGVCIA